MIIKLMKAIDVNVILGNDEQQQKWKQVKLFNFFFVFQKFTNTAEDPYYLNLSILLTKWKNGDGKEKGNYDECKSIEVFKWVQTS